MRGDDGLSDHDAGPMSLTRPREPIRGRVAVLAVAYALLVLLQRSAEATSLSLFLDHLGAKRLPETFVAVSLIDVPLAFAYMYLARHLNRRWFLVGLGGALVGALAGARLLSILDPGWGLFVAYLGAATLGTFLVIHWGVLLLDAFTIDESRRAFPLVYAGGHVGSFLAGAAMQLAGTWRVQDLLVAIPGVSLAGLAVTMVLLGRQTEEERFEGISSYGRARRQGPKPGRTWGCSPLPPASRHRRVHGADGVAPSVPPVPLRP